MKEKEFKLLKTPPEIPPSFYFCPLNTLFSWNRVQASYITLILPYPSLGLLQHTENNQRQKIGSLQLEKTFILPNTLIDFANRRHFVENRQFSKLAFKCSISYTILLQNIKLGCSEQSLISCSFFYDETLYELLYLFNAVSNSHKVQHSLPLLAL